MKQQRKERSIMKLELKKLASFVTAIIVLILVAASSQLSAEQTLRFEAVPDESSVRIDGTSTAHDWTVKGKTIDGHIEFKTDVPAGAPAEEVKAALIANPQATVEVEIPVKSIRSDKKGMDKKMYEALKEKDHPIIEYELTEATVAEGSTSEQKTFELQTKGKLTVAGKTRDLEMPMTVEVIDSDHVKFSGSTSLKMTDFKVKPPEAMLGLIKSGNEVHVQVEWMTVRTHEAIEPETDAVAGTSASVTRP
jgi:polyisoprenoid-binding protein YceI